MDGEIDELRAIVHAALVTPSPLERYRSGLIRRAAHGAIALISDGAPGPDFNRALVLGPAQSRRVFALADAFFGDTASYTIIIEADAAPTVESAVLARGWQLDEEEAALVLSPVPTVLPSLPADLIIRRVGDADGLADFRGVSETPSVFLPSLDAALDPEVALFVGYCEGRPVATSRLSCLGSIAEIMGVVTVPEARRRGYGTALTCAAIAAATERGCTVAMLTATALGYPVYIRMGFRPAGIYRTYLLPGRAQEG
jgi:ribosomal protein S18 acetylase RimI-like enzyme